MRLPRLAQAHPPPHRSLVCCYDRRRLWVLYWVRHIVRHIVGY